MTEVCLFGDSISKGVVISENQARYSMTANSFANLISAGESQLKINNYSMFGCTVSKGECIIARHSKAVEACDLTVLEYGGNDSDHDWAQIAENPDAMHLPKTSLDDFRKKYTEILNRLMSLGKSIVLLNLPPIDEIKYFAWLSRGLNRENILKWLGGSERFIYDFHEGYSHTVTELAHTFKLPLIDIRSAFLQTPNYTNYLCDDGIHPNETGHHLMAEIISRSLQGEFGLHCQD